jgi:hypothetical protein
MVCEPTWGSCSSWERVWMTLSELRQKQIWQSKGFRVVCHLFHACHSSCEPGQRLSAYFLITGRLTEKRGHVFPTGCRVKVSCFLSYQRASSHHFSGAPLASPSSSNSSRQCQGAAATATTVAVCQGAAATAATVAVWQGAGSSSPG